MFEEFITDFFMWCVYICIFATSFNNIIFYSLEKREEKEQQ